MTDRSDAIEMHRDERGVFVPVPPSDEPVYWNVFTYAYPDTASGVIVPRFIGRLSADGSVFTPRATDADA